ncbi:MAG TPA: glycoside hydrolase family 20 zincin-like fold domain-containing protein [Armatimonadota bacterium]|nr:glycoside hydrolase family 20 zincin-like fold domain-containing protein [Armatimonadota bacterium]
MMPHRALLLLTTLALLAVSGGTSWSLTNLLPNPGMETDANGDGLADGWTGDVHAREGAEGSFAIDTEVKHSGEASQRIDHTSDNRAWVRTSVAQVPTRPDGIYRADVWVRGTGHFSVLLYEFFQGEKPYRSESLGSGDATGDWQLISKLVSTAEDTAFFKLSLIADGPGSGWFDDASRVLIAERPTLRVPRSEVAPAVDGALDDPAWAAATRATDFMVLSGEGERAPVDTRALVCFDDQALYIGFQCAEPNVAGIKMAATEDGHDVWGDDCVEVFLDIERDRASYLHLGVSAGGFRWQDRRLASSWYTNWYSTGGGDVAPPVWDAAAKVGADSWTAELRLPFDQIGGPPRIAAVWGANFCRTRRAASQEQNLVWSYTAGEFYAVPERFGTLVFATGPAQPPALATLGADYEAARPAVVPRPQQLEWAGGSFRPAAGTRVMLGDGVDTAGAEMLAADLRERFGIELQIASGPPAPGAVSVSLAPGDAELKPEGYRLTVTPESVSIAGKDVSGAFYGLQTLRQMVTQDAGGPMLLGCRVVDWPDIAWRGWHLSGPSQADLPTYRRFIDLLALLKFNQLCLEVNSSLQYQSHPEIARSGAPTKDELRELVAYARSRHMLVFPQLATFAHFGYVLNVPAHRHLAEAPEGSTLGNNDRFNYCPSNPETRPLVFDLMDELIEVFEPQYFHIGRDEATFDDIGTCPLCKGQAPSKLFTDDIIALHDHLSERGITTLMWGDCYLPSHNGIRQYNIAEATDDLPKDIIICDWHYSADYDFDASLAYWREHGFKALGCPWYEPLNVWNFATRARENNILGYMGTTWAGIGSHIGRYPHLEAAWVLGGENTWSVEHPAIAEVDYAPVPQFNRLWEMGRARPERFRLVDIAPLCNESTVDTDGRGGWMDLGPQYDLRNLPIGRVWIGETPFALVDPAANHGRSCIMLADATTRPELYPESVWEIPVGVKARSLRFLVTCSVPRQKDRAFYDRRNIMPTTVGWYTIVREDGSEEKVELVYQANVDDWNCQRGPSQALDLWRGATASGALATLGVCDWVNPTPDAPIASVSNTSAMGQVRPVLLGLTAVE